MANLISLNNARANGVSLIALFGAVEHKADNIAALSDVRGAAIVNIASALEGAENATVPNVMAYGASRAVLQFVLKVEASSLDKADKKAIGFADLPAQSPAKRRLSQYHSRLRRIAEDYDTIPQVERDELIAGTRSFLSVYDGIIKREKAANKAAADKAAAEQAAQAAATAIEQAVEQAVEQAAPSAPVGLLELLESAIAAYADADAETRDLAADLIAELAILNNADIEAAPMAEAA